MRILLALFGWLVVVAVCRADSPADDSPPLLLVYAVKYGDNALPKIALGLEKPALKIRAFDKCVTLSDANPKLGGLAAQLKTDDAKALVAAIRGLAAPDAKDIPMTILWFTTSNNKALGFMNTGNPPSNGTNLEQAGILFFDTDDGGALIKYLIDKLHLR